MNEGSCAKGSVYGPSRDVPGATAYLRADCRKLTCPHCGPKKARRYRNAIAKRAEENKLTRHMTLTLDPAKLGEGQDSVGYIRGCFSKFRVYLGRKYGRISFIAILELQPKSGRAHLHCLIGRYIPQAWISAAWDAVGGGRIVDIRFVDVHRVAAYLSKYVTKEMLLLVPAQKKRISTSRDIQLFEPKVKGAWVLSHDGIEFLFETVPGDLHDFKFDDFGLLSFLVDGGGSCPN